MKKQGNGTPPQQNGGGGRTPPHAELSVGRLKAVIWKNNSDDGPWYSVAFSRRYQDSSGTWKSAETFGRDDLLALTELSRAAWTLIAKEHGANLP